MTAAVHTHHIIYSYFHLEDSYARFHLENCLDCSIPDFLNSLISLGDDENDMGTEGQEDRWMKYFTEVECFIGSLNNFQILMSQFVTFFTN